MYVPFQLQVIAMKNMPPFIMILLILGILLAALMAQDCWYIVNPGFTALHLRLGQIITSQEQAGFYYKFPFIDAIIYINNRISKSVIETTALSKDLQSVSIGVAINYKINNPVQLYQSVGTDFEHIIIDPFAQESIKAVVAQYTAEDLIQYRHAAKEKVFEELSTRLKPLYITLIDFNFVHSDFSPDFIHAVEEKQIAEQSAKTAHNLTEKVKEEAIQTRTRAEAQAYALKIKKEAVTTELIHLQKVEALFKAIEKWDGKLSRVAGNTTPFIALDQL